jgi:hypothetical protein
MSYHLGEAAASAKKTPLGVPYVLTPTLERDGFDSLYAAYKSAFPAGTSRVDFAKAIVAANDIRYTVPAIEAWIFGMSKKRFDFNAKDNPGMYGGTKNVGWSHFAAGNKIMLPDVARPGVTPPAPPAPPAPTPPAPSPSFPGPATTSEDLKTPEQTPWWQSPVVLGAGALAVVAVLFVAGDDEGKTAKE